MSRKLHEAEVMALQVQINNLKTDVAYQKTIVAAQKEELEMKSKRLSERLADHVTTADSYAKLLKDHDRVVLQYKTHMAATEVRLSEAIESRDKARREANAAIELLMEKSRPWYKKLFNVKTK